MCIPVHNVKFCQICLSCVFRCFALSLASSMSGDWEKEGRCIGCICSVFRSKYYARFQCKACKKGALVRLKQCITDRRGAWQLTLMFAFCRVSYTMYIALSILVRTSRRAKPGESYLHNQRITNAGKFYESFFVIFVDLAWFHTSTVRFELEAISGGCSWGTFSTMYQ